MARTWLLELEGTTQDLDDLALVLQEDAEIVRDSGRVWLKSDAEFDSPAAFTAWSRDLVAVALRRSEILLGQQLDVRTGQLEERDADGRRRAHVLLEGAVTARGSVSGTLTVSTQSREVSATAALSLEYDPAQLVLRTTKLEIARLAPSFGVLAKLLDGGIDLDRLTWREFEELIADLLQQDGFAVVLGSGRNDGGKDLIATKAMDETGAFMAVWQAKKYKIGNHVQLAVIRELADTRQQEGASKGIIATTSYLASGALKRVQREQFQLGKVDRDDLYRWIERLARRGSG